MVSLCMSPMAPRSVSTMAAWTTTDTCSCLSSSHVCSFSRLSLGSAASLRQCIPLFLGRPCKSSLGKRPLSAPGSNATNICRPRCDNGSCGNPSSKWTLKSEDLAAPETESFFLIVSTAGNSWRTLPISSGSLSRQMVTRLSDEVDDRPLFDFESGSASVQKERFPHNTLQRV